MKNNTLNIGLIADIHYADKPKSSPESDRYYRQSSKKVSQAVDTFNNENVDFIVLLGDTIDAVDKETDIKHLKKINELLSKFKGPKYYVMGNHCLEALDKETFLNNIRGNNSAYYSFSKKQYFFVVLDANYRKDGVEYCSGNFRWQDSYLPSQQIEWLKKELHRAKKEEKKTIIFIHQLLDSEPPQGIENAEIIRNVLKDSENVMAVFQGHHHKGGYNKINGIHYVTIPAMITGNLNDNHKNNSYVLVNIKESNLKIKGYGTYRQNLQIIKGIDI